MRRADGPGVRDALAVAACTFCLCALLVRGLWHGLDAYSFLSHLDRGVWQNPRHPLYLPIVGVVVAVLGPLGVTTATAAALASALGAGLGAGFLHRACAAFGMCRRDALMTTATAMSCFGVLYYGSMVEVHGVFLMPAGLAWWLLARWLARPTAWSAALLGGATGLAAATHATGHLLVPLFLLMAAARAQQWTEVLGRWPSLLSWALLHAAFGFGLRRLLLPAAILDDLQPESSPATYFAFLGGLGTEWREFPRVLWNEWLMPFAPISLLAPLALVRAPLRRLAVAFSLALLGYLAFTTVLLAPAAALALPAYVPPFAMLEYGAYFLPLLLPAAILARAVVPPRFGMLLPACGLVLALVVGMGWERQPGDPGLGRDILAVVDDDARVLLGGYRELDSALSLRPDCISEPTHGEPRSVLPVYGLHLWLARIPEFRAYDKVTLWFDVQVQQVRGKGGRLILSDEAMALLRETGDGLLDRLVKEHIPAHYRLVPIQSGRFAGVVVEPAQ